MATYPNVQTAPGVPSLLRVPGSVGSVLSQILLAADAILNLSNFFEEVQWGIFLNGQNVIPSDNCVSMEYKQDWTIADYPLEGGAFQSYDKVLLPFTARVRLSAGGSIANRQNMLSAIAFYAGSLSAFTVVTPEQTYTNVNITHYDYKRTATDGAGLLQVDVWLRQILVPANGSTNFTNTQAPSGTAQTNDGLVAPGTPAPIIPVTTEIL